MSMKIGVISDTHGLLRPEAIEAIRSVDHILHAGDVGDSTILDQLRQLAPLTAIRGNVDHRGPCSRLPEVELIELNGHSIYILHDVQALDLDPVAAGIQVVISGHSHKPLIEWKKGVLYFNPGSAGPRRFSLPVSVGYLNIREGRIEPELLTIG
jgi:putative phosphoesterase